MPKNPWNYIGSGSIPTDPDVEAYIAELSGLGSTITSLEEQALTTFALGLKAAGLWVLARRINPLMGSVLAGAAAALVKNVGGSVDVLSNYVGSDWSVLQGLQGNGTNTNINPNWQPTAAQMLGYFGAYYSGNDAIVTGSIALFGGINSAGGDHIGIRNNGTDLLAYLGQTTWEINYGASGLERGLSAINRETVDYLELIQGISPVDSSIAVNTLGDLNTPLLIGATGVHGGPMQNVMGPGQYLGGYFFFDALTAAQITALGNLIQAMYSTIGR